MSASPAPTAAPPKTKNNNNDNDPYFNTLDSIMRVSVAGFGGALAGMSFARRRGGGATAIKQAAAVLTKASGRSSTHSGNEMMRSSSARAAGGGGSKRLPRQRPIIRTTHPSATPYVDRELPTAWAMACMAFAGIIECTRAMSPTSIIWDFTRREENNDSPATIQTDDDNNDALQVGGNKDQFTSGWENVRSAIDEAMDSSTLTSIADYTIGGAIAGAIFKGSAVRTPTGARIDASIMGTSTAAALPANLKSIRGRPLSGILPGAALGLMAGVAVVAMERGQVVVQEKFGHLDDDDDDYAVEEFNRDEAPIPADIKAMSNEELMKSIDNLKSGKIGSSGSSDDSGDGREPTHSSQTASMTGAKSDEHGEVHDFIFALGFRSYPSK